MAKRHKTCKLVVIAPPIGNYYYAPYQKALYFKSIGALINKANTVMRKFKRNLATHYTYVHCVLNFKKQTNTVTVQVYIGKPIPHIYTNAKGIVCTMWPS